MGSYLWRSLSALRREKRDISGNRGIRTSYPSHRPKLRGKEIKIGRRPSCTEHALIRREGVVHSYFNSIYSNYFNLFQRSKHSICSPFYASKDKKKPLVSIRGTRESLIYLFLANIPNSIRGRIRQKGKSLVFISPLALHRLEKSPYETPS